MISYDVICNGIVSNIGIPQETLRHPIGIPWEYNRNTIEEYYRNPKESHGSPWHDYLLGLTQSEDGFEQRGSVFVLNCHG